MTYAVLGPRGTFSEEAAYRYWGDEVDLTTADSVDEVFRLVQNGQVEGALVPLENSLTGSVQPTLRGLEQSAVYIGGEITLEIKQHLMARQKYDLDEIELLISHPLALLQCDIFIKKFLPGVRSEITESTARAAQILYDEQRKAASIGNDHAARLYGLEVIQRDIGDEHNQTRFVYITGKRQELSGDKCSLIFSVPDQPGALYRTLEVLACQGLNMSKIESRPHRCRQNCFSFYTEIDLAGKQVPMEELLEKMSCCCQDIKYLGSYPSITARDLALR